ncbi:MAG: hypothetical protein E7391_02580 [Ruminococcaceae bacterium]|nr:hypothetical protein [Oscillospiraceae bacterium]
MADIVGIGANVCDTLFEVPHYPKEDTKLKAEGVKLSGGGPCATGLVAASKLGADCAYIGALTDDASGVFLNDDLKKYNVSTEFVTYEKGYNSFSSCIWLSKESASRTCVFFRGNIPPVKLNDNQKNAIKEAKILMIDGNEMDAAIEGARIANENGTKVLYDAGGLYEGVENLLPYADILIPSEEFAVGHTGAKDARAAAKILYEKYNPEIVVITQGKKGGIIFDGKQVKEYPAFLVDAVDSNGSGDVFHGAFAFSVNKGYNYYDACVFSSAVSALKCTKVGSRESVPTFEETINFLKERGINV